MESLAQNLPFTEKPDSCLEEISIREGVEFAYNQHPELAAIGTLEEYTKYVETVFPDSKFKEVAYHNSESEFKDEGFKPTKPNFDTLNSIEGVYNFTTNRKFAEQYGKNTYVVLLDTHNPIEDSTSGEFADDMDRPLSEALFRTGKRVRDNDFAPEFDEGLKNTDAVINHISGEGYIAKHPMTGNEIGMPPQTIISVFNHNQIHILGSKSDAIKFSNFIEEKKREQKENGIEIYYTKESASVLFRNLELNAENHTSPEIIIFVEKQPIELVEGKSYGNHTVLIDKETEAMKSLASEAEALSEIPERERPSKILDLLRNKLHYAYNDVIENLSETDPALAIWVTENTGINAPHVSDIPLSEIIDKGYGVCRHLSIAYLWLAQKAGLKGVLLSSDWGTIINIERSDTKQKLFRSAGVGEPVAAHSWVEIKTSDGKWIPVDPSTKLVGDSDERLGMFREANYLAFAGWGAGMEFEAEPADQLDPNGAPLLFAPGEVSATGKCSLELHSSKPTIRFRRENLPPTNIPYSGEAKLRINTVDQNGGMVLDIVDVKVS